MTRLRMPTIDRRGFLRASAATGLAATLPMGGATAAPRRGGTLRKGKAHGNTADTLDPATFTNGFTVALSYGVHGFLTEVAPDGSVAPNLAESWDASDDARTWRFRLRPGVTFHSGKKLTVEDVIVSINYHRGEESTSAAKPIVAPITDIRADGDNTVVFELEAGNADFPFTLTDYHLIIGPAKDGALDWRSGDGCGVYRLDNFEPGVRADFTRHDGHWDDQRGWFDAIEMISLVDLNARTTSLVSGEVDVIDKLDLKTVNLLARNPDVRIESVSGNLHYTFAMDVTRDPYQDNHVRLALKHAINREELVEKILFGYGSVGNDHPIGRGQRFFNEDLEQRTYDPDKARHHLRKAGVDNLTVNLSAADAAYPGAVDAAVLYRNSAGEAGIEVDVVREPNDGYWSDVWRKKEFVAVYWGGRPVEDQMFTTAYKCGAAWNDTNWCNERFDDLLIKARAELDQTRRREMYYEMQKLVSDDGGTVVPMFADWVFATNERIGHPEQMASNWDVDGERWMERWWFK